mgnify:CR=1 FL=1
MSKQHFAFGSIVLLEDEDGDNSGLLETNGCVLVNSYTLIHAELDRENGEPQTVIGCQIAGQITESGDTINTVYLLNPHEAGELVRGLTSAAEHLTTQEWAQFLIATHGGGDVSGDD